MLLVGQWLSHVSYIARVSRRTYDSECKKLAAIAGVLEFHDLRERLPIDVASDVERAMRTVSKMNDLMEQLQAQRKDPFDCNNREHERQICKVRTNFCCSIVVAFD